MKNNNNDQKERFLSKINTLYSSHKLAIILAIGLLYFAGAAFVQSYWKAEDNASATPQEMTPALAKTIASLQNQITLLSASQLTGEPKEGPHTDPKLVTLTLIHAVLEGRLPLKKLKIFLEINQHPWPESLRTTLQPIKDIHTYAQLEETLILPPPPTPPSFFKHMKQKIETLIHIKKQDQMAETPLGKIDQMKHFLAQGALQKALDVFATLPPDDMKFLAAWQKRAQDRLYLEKFEDSIILSLAEGKPYL